jgi:acyl carrier protein
MATNFEQPAVLDHALVVATIVAAVATQVRCAPEEIGGQDVLMGELGLDSTSILELLMTVEEELDIELDVDSLLRQHLRTPETLADYIVAQSGE